MKIQGWTRRATASMIGLAAVLALGIAPAQSDGAPATATNVIREPQTVTVLADGESGLKRPV